MKEHQHLEWKEAWRDEHLKWVCAFANGDGGVLVIGRDDQGDVVGIADASKLLEDLPNKIRDLLGILVTVRLRTEGAREYLEIATQAYPAPISYRGHYYVRSGSTLQELKGAALDRFLLSRYGRTWDGAPLPGVGIADLSASAFVRFRHLATRSGRLDREALEESDAGLLSKLKLTEGAYYKRAAVLLFYPDPLRFVTGAFVKIGFFRSASDLAYHDEVVGDLFAQVQGTLDLLLTKYLKAAVTYEGIQRVERWPVPRDALREAVLNALVHRDYAVPAPVQIRVMDDRLVFWNPAVLPDGWTIDTLRGPHASRPYNPELANAFFRAGEIEAWGRGIERIYEVCRKDGSPPPELRYEAGGLWLEFPFAQDYLRAIAGSLSRNPAGLLGVATQETTQETTQERICRLLRDNPRITRQALAGLLDLTPDGVKYHLAKLKAAGRIRHVGPTKAGHWEVLK
jgi:ATP-dependent DNA helicase RecG